MTAVGNVFGNDPMKPVKSQGNLGKDHTGQKNTDLEDAERTD